MRFFCLSKTGNIFLTSLLYVKGYVFSKSLVSSSVHHPLFSFTCWYRLFLFAFANSRSILSLVKQPIPNVILDACPFGILWDPSLALLLSAISFQGSVVCPSPFGITLVPPSNYFRFPFLCFLYFFAIFTILSNQSTGWRGECCAGSLFINPICCTLLWSLIFIA